MWIALFIFTIGAAGCFVVAAMVLQSPRQDGAMKRSRRSAAATSGHPALLHRRMQVLRLDPEELKRADPPALQELSSRCQECAEQARCKSDLVSGETVENWRDYCPNAAMLNALQTLRDCCSGARAVTVA